MRLHTSGKLASEYTLYTFLYTQYLIQQYAKKFQASQPLHPRPTVTPPVSKPSTSAHLLCTVLISHKGEKALETGKTNGSSATWSPAISLVAFRS